MREERKREKKRQSSQKEEKVREKEWEGGLNERGKEDKVQADREKKRVKNEVKVGDQFNYFIVSSVISLEVKNRRMKKRRMKMK